METLDITRNFCTKLGWKYKDAGEFIVIGFDVEDRLKPIYIKQKVTTTQGIPIIEVSFFGGDISKDDVVNASLTLLLLKRNAKLSFGSWLIRKAISDDVVEFRYNIESVQLSQDRFIEMVGTCIEEIKYFTSIRNLQ